MGCNDGTTRAKPLAACIAPAQLILIVESNADWSEMNLDGCWSWFNHNDANCPAAVFAGHNGMCNFAFADGHVKAMKPSQTVSATTPLNMWDCAGPNTAPFGNSVSEMTQISNYYSNR